MQRTRDIVSLLLALDAREGSAGEKRIGPYTAFAGTVNLFFCGYMDHLIKFDPGGQYLALLLFVESSAVMIIAIGEFTRRGSEILTKTSLFPTTAWARLLFVLSGVLRKGLTKSLLLTTALFFFVFYYPSVLLGGLAVLFYLLLVANVLLATVAVVLKLARSSQPLIGAAALGVVLIIVVLASSIVFHVQDLLMSLPVLSWAVSGIRSAVRPASLTVFLKLAYLMASLVVMVFIAKRAAR